MQKFVYKLPQKSEKKNFVFNMLGSLANATVSLVLMVVVSHVCDDTLAGVFSLAFSTAQMMYTISVFEMRNIQVTDAKGEFSFGGIVTFRIITTAVMWLFFIAFAFFKNFDKETVIVMAIITAYMTAFSFSDLFQGNLHRNGYLSLAGRSLACQVSLMAIVFTITLIISKKLIFAVITMPIVIVIWVILHDLPLNNNFDVIKPKFNLQSQIRMLLCAAPLFLSSFMHQYIFNSPKYAIEDVLTKADQAHYGYLVMPVFAINLLSIFVFRPQLISLSKNWAENKLTSFIRTTIKLYVWVVIVTIAALIAGRFLGIPVLELLYNAELSDKTNVFMILLLSGGFSAASTLTLTLFTTMRKQYLCLIAYAVTFVFALIMPRIFVKNRGLIGAAEAYLCEMVLLFAVMAILFVIVIINSVLRNKKRGEKTDV